MQALVSILVNMLWNILIDGSMMYKSTNYPNQGMHSKILKHENYNQLENLDYVVWKYANCPWIMAYLFAIWRCLYVRSFWYFNLSKLNYNYVSKIHTASPFPLEFQAMS
jgi:hypothetical protein